MKNRAFTLMEVMLALSISTVVLAGIGSVFFSAMRLRRSTTEILEKSIPVYQALTLMRRDLQGVVPPGGTIFGDFKGGTINIGTAQGTGLQFCTATGVINDSAPWGDIQQVIYTLRDPTERSTPGGKDLVRILTRNLLNTSGPDLNEQWLLGNVRSLDFAYYDGNAWRDSWNSSLGDTNLPSAVRVSINLEQQQQMELVIPLDTKSRTNVVQTAQ